MKNKIWIMLFVMGCALCEAGEREQSRPGAVHRHRLGVLDIEPVSDGGSSSHGRTHYVQLMYSVASN